MLSRALSTISDIEADTGQTAQQVGNGMNGHKPPKAKAPLPPAAPRARRGADSASAGIVSDEFIQHPADSYAAADEPAVPCATSYGRTLMFDPTRDHLAKRLCADCPVISECAKLGADEDFGTWGGLSLMDRLVAGWDHQTTTLRGLILKLDAAGYTTQQIAQAFGRTPANIKWNREQFSTAHRKPGQRIAVNIPQVIALRNQGKNPTEIARILHTSRQAVAYQIQKLDAQK